MKLFVAHKMTRNNTLNKVHVAATELPQLLLQNTDTFGEATAQSRCQTSLCPALTLTEKNEFIVEVEEAHARVPHSWRRP